MSTIKVDTIATRTGSGNITASNTIAGTSATLSGTLGVTGHAAVGASIVAGTRALSIAGATDGGSSEILNCFNSSLASKFSVRDDGLTTVNGQINASNGIAIGGTGAANLLDDYEEGSWTPTNSDVSITTSSGYYIKIGRLVTITARINFPTNSNSSTTNIGGLPFAVDDNLSNSAMGGAVGETTYTGSDRPMAAVEVSDVIRFRINGGTSMTNANWSNKSVRFSLTYFSTS